MPSPEQRLFDIDKVAPIISAAERMVSFQRTYEKTGVKNAKELLERNPLYLQTKVGKAAVGQVLTITGVEIVVGEDDLPPAA
jgi:hypothetical protein